MKRACSFRLPLRRALGRTKSITYVRGFASLPPNAISNNPIGKEGHPSRKGFRGPLKAAILDWSGTTADAHVLAPAVVFVEAFAKHGVKISMQEARLPMGLRKDMHIAKILEIPEVRQRWIGIKGEEPTPTTVVEIFADFVPMQLACLGKYSDLIPGTVEAVDTLRNEFGLKIGITTGFTKVMVDQLLEDAAKQGFVPDCSVAGDEVPNDMGFRPAPFMVYENLVKLGVFPIDSVVKVDDTVGGVGEGLNAGAWTIGLAAYSNYTDVDSMEEWNAMHQEERDRRIEISRAKLLDSGAHYVVDSIRDVPACVKDINERLAGGQRP